MNTLIPVASSPGGLQPSLSTEKASQLLNTFLAGKSERTLKAYKQDLGDFTAWTQAESIDQAAYALLSQGPGEANHIALNYKNHMIDKGLQPSTVNRRLSALRSLITAAQTIGLVSWSLKIKNEKVQKYRDTRGPGSSAIVQMLRHLQSQNTPKAVRDSAIVRLAYDLGLRRGSICALDLADVDLTNGTLRYTPKGQSQKRSRPLPDLTKEALSKWIQIRGLEPGPLFHNVDRAKKGNGRLTGAAVYAIIKRLGEDVGIKTRPHALRHSSATVALTLAPSNGLDIRAVKAHCDHGDVRTTLIYDDSQNEREYQERMATLVSETARV